MEFSASVDLSLHHLCDHISLDFLLFYNTYFAQSVAYLPGELTVQARVHCSNPIYLLPMLCILPWVLVPQYDVISVNKLS